MGGGNMQQMMRQAQKMQQQMVEKIAELETRSYEASLGGGAVSVKVSGKREVLSLTLTREAVDPDDVDLLQDMIVSAVNEALRKCDAEREAALGKLGGGMGGLF
jgi:DNA-binding YbaB/EbfC family protein